MSQIQCEVAIIGLTNLNVDDLNLPLGKLFIRYYVYAGGGRRIQVDTRENPCISDPHWDERSSMECSVQSDSMKQAIFTGNVVFELRWRRERQVFSMKSRSKLLGRAEVAWEEDNGSAEKQVRLVMKKPVTEGLKPPTLLVRMGIRVRVSQAKEIKREGNECRCESCGWIGSEEDMFLAATVGSRIDAW